MKGKSLTATAMRFLWALSILSTMLSMGLLVIITGQQSMMAMLDKPFKLQLAQLEKRYENTELFKALLEKMVAERTEVLEDLEAAMAKLNPEMERKKTENEDCQIEQNTNSEDLAFMERKHTEIEAVLITQSGSWTKEISLLTEQLTGHSEICNYMRTDALAEKLCGPNQLNLS